MEQLIKCVIIYMKECIYFNLYTQREDGERNDKGEHETENCDVSVMEKRKRVCVCAETKYGSASEV